jgi:CRISPR-associated endonuclease/helicase Cas3
MTSLQQAEYPRPLIEYWLRGVTDDDTWQTVLCWRADLNYAATCEQAEAMVQIIAIASQEKATLATFRAVEMLKTLAKSFPETIVVLIDGGGEYSARKLKDLPIDSRRLFALVAYATVIIPSQCGGLDEDGNPSSRLTKKNQPVPDVVNADEWRRYAIKRISAGEYECGQLNSVSGAIDNLRSFSSLIEALAFCTTESKGICVNARELRRSFTDIAENESGENGSGERFQFAYFLNRNSSEHYLREDDDIASLGLEGERGRTVTEHDSDVERYARALAEKIGLPSELVTALGIAGKKHDEGKNRDWWQAAIGNANDGSPAWKPLAKSTHNSFDHSLNQGYRHEFGSLVEANADGLLKAHPHRDLILHLIATHHGYARPHFPARAFDRNLPRAFAQKLMEETMQRFLRLQRQYGWWQLAYLEAIVKAADALASRDFSRGTL